MNTPGGYQDDSAAERRSPYYTLTTPASPGVPILVAAPHGGRSYSPELTKRMRQADYSALKLEDRYVDLLAEQIAKKTSASLLVAHAPRAMVDLNRAREDVDWEMVSGNEKARAPRSLANRRARNGLGLVPRRLPGLGEIWNQQITRSELDYRIEAIHRPYHRSLAQELENLRDRWGAALLVDLHSMPPLGRDRHSGERGPELRPELGPELGPELAAEFVLGDRFGASCDAMLASRALNFLSSGGRRVAHNRPYAGGYVLDAHGSPSRQIHALQIEVCRSIYLDSDLREPSAGFEQTTELLADLVRALAAEVVQLNRGSSFSEAAE